MPAPPSDPWLTTAEVADRLRQPESTIRYWRAKKKNGPRGVLMGSRVLYRTSEVERFECELERAQGAAGGARI